MGVSSGEDGREKQQQHTSSMVARDAGHASTQPHRLIGIVLDWTLAQFWASPLLIVILECELDSIEFDCDSRS
jgi:hypothetical protein